MSLNKTAEQKARDIIDQMLINAGWIVQAKRKQDRYAGKGVAVAELQTAAGFADYVLYINGKAVGIIEAKAYKKGIELVTTAQEQAEKYAKSGLKYQQKKLFYVYVSNGATVSFTNYKDPKPRSRPIFHFHRPETLERWERQDANLRTHLQKMPLLLKEGLRPAQIIAIENLEESFKKNRPKALIQMATGSGKTFTACTFVYRLLKHAKAQRVLFLVDTRNLGEQAENEFNAYQPKDDNRKFKELYNIQRLKSNFVAADSHVCISTVQRLYSILKGSELDESSEDISPLAQDWKPKAPPPVVYNPHNPIEQFDFIVVDECHRSIYGLWSQVLEYYDAFLIGLTATPDKRTFGYFNKILVSEYTYQDSVTDGVNVPFDEYIIETEISTQGATVKAKESIKYREKLSRKERWDINDEETTYKSNKLDKEVVNPSQIRQIIREFKRAVQQEIFPKRIDQDGEYEMPKTLIFAKTDSHANDIITIVREEFDEGNDFCKKITDGARKDKEDPKTSLNLFRNNWNPRIAVTVDMIATGTDVKPLELLLFLRNVKSANYFEQMKGRGCRTISLDDLRQVTRTAKHTKTHFVLVDAVGVLKNKKTTSRPLNTKKSVSFKGLLEAVSLGQEDAELFSTLADRLIRLEKQITAEEKADIQEKSGGRSVKELAKNLLNAYDPDVISEQATALKAAENLPSMELAEERVKAQLLQTAARPFTGEFCDFLENIRRVHEQLIDVVNLDNIIRSEWSGISQEKAAADIVAFKDYIVAHKDEIQAISFFYQQPFARRGLTRRMVKQLLKHLKVNKPQLAPLHIWKAYEQVEEVKGDNPLNELTALVALLRRVTGADDTLTTYNSLVDKKFQDWIFKQNAGQSNRFSAEQMDWLRAIKTHIASNFDVQQEDLDYTPFDSMGGRLKMKQLFQTKMQPIMEELNGVLVA